MIPQTFIFIGRSGCGKGTQSDLLHKYINANDKDEHLIFYLETGARFREFMEKENFSSKLAKDISLKGDRQPDFLAVWMWSNILLENFTDSEHLIVDGAPRSLPEARVFDSAIKFYRRKNTTVIYLNVDRKWSETHLQRRGRADDINVNEVKRRLDWFEKDVVPAVEYFKENKDYRFFEVNGEQTPEKVHYDIIQKAFGENLK
ncbi:MAG TPA: nucleoside monophosphate kinase [Candidatus Paceibacterota bacterium]|nr:nucleoside monophosphate kinase [Candidatus Paceibacterota bacterium]